MQTEKLDLAVDILEDLRRVIAKIQSAESLKSREMAIVLTNAETAKLWLYEVVQNCQASKP